MTQTLTIRRATLDDTAVIVEHRRMMFESMNRGTAEERAKMAAVFAEWLPAQIASEAYIGWFACEDERIIGGVGLHIHDWMVNTFDLSGKRGYVANVFIDPAYRRQGIARLLMSNLIDWCSMAGIGSLTLYPSDQAGNFYETLGFTYDQRWMVKRLPQDTF